MPGKQYAVLSAGSKLYFEDPDTPDTYIWLEEALKIGSSGEQAGFVKNTPIAHTTHRYMPGMMDTPDKEFVFNDVPGNADQEKFLQLASERQTVKMKTELTSGRVAIYSVALGGYVVNEPEEEGAVTVTVAGKQSGKTEWSVV